MQGLVTSVNARVNCLAMFALTLVAGLAFAFSSTQAAHDPTEHIKEVLNQNATAFEKSDMATLDKIWANDESVTVFEQGHANYGWKDYRDNHLGPEMKEMKNTKYLLSDIKAKVEGTTAWATFKYTISADVGERHVDGSGLGTAILEKRGQQWQIVHWHSSAPRRAPTPAASPAKN